MVGLSSFYLCLQFPFPRCMFHLPSLYLFSLIQMTTLMAPEYLRRENSQFQWSSTTTLLFCTRNSGERSEGWPRWEWRQARRAGREAAAGHRLAYFTVHGAAAGSDDLHSPDSRYRHAAASLFFLFCVQIMFPIFFYNFCSAIIFFKSFLQLFFLEFRTFYSKFYSFQKNSISFFFFIFRCTNCVSNFLL